MGVGGSASSLLCFGEPPSSDDEDPSITADDINIPSIITPDHERFVQELLDREITNSANTHHMSRQIPAEEWARKARTEAIDDYILKASKRLLGCKHRVAYFAVTYLDRILARIRSDCPERALKVLPMACFSLACKMGAGTIKLSKLPRLACPFDSDTIKNAEVWVFFTLEWSMGPITPFDFVHYFASIFSRDSPTITISAISDVILAAVRDKDLIRNRPSVIAAAATLVKLDPRLNRKDLEPRLNASSVSQSLDIEKVWSCYNHLSQPLGIFK